MSDMEFLDPRAEHRHRILLYVGYGLIAIAVAVASLIMLYLSYGYNLNRDGEVDQNGIVFVSSTPDTAEVRFGNKLLGTTNDRFLMASGQYDIVVSKKGYRSWKHTALVQGGDVQRFTYIRLFPSTLSSSALHSFATAPQLATQSPDRRWLLIKNPDTPAGFLEYDLRNPLKPATSEFALAAEVFTAANAHSWKLVEWSSDNKHCLLQHSYTVGETTGTEYLLVDRETPAKTVNLTKKFSLTEGDQPTLLDKKPDRFYIFNPAAKTLRTTDLAGQALTTPIDHVRAFKSYGANLLLYVSDAAEGTTADSDHVRVIMSNDTRQLTLRKLPANAPGYLLDIADYDGQRYVVVAATNDKGVYLYKNPMATPVKSTTLPNTFRFFPLTSPTAVSFSSSAQFLAIQNSSSMVVFDAFDVDVERFGLPKPLEAPQTAVKWMDGDHLTYVSGGELMVYDYDSQNGVALVKASPLFTPFFSRDYSSLLAFSPQNESGATSLTLTPLVLEN